MKIVSVIISLLILFLLCPNLGNAQGNFWGQVLNSNEIASITEDPSGVLFAAGARGEVFKSSDFGSHWKSITTNGLPPIYPISWLSAMNSTNLICRIYNKGLFLSSDGGSHWSSIGDSDFIKRLIRIRKSPQGYLFGLNSTTVYRSTDEGISWTKIFDDSTTSLVTLCFDSSNHVLIAARDRIKRCHVDDSLWADLGFSASGTVLSSLSVAPNGDVFAGGSLSLEAACFVYRDSKWTFLCSLPYGQAIIDIAVDSAGVIYGLGSDGPTIKSTDYGYSFSKSINGNVQCSPNSYFLSRSGYLFSPESCGILRSVNRVGDTILHFPSSSLSQCSARTIGENMNQIRSMILKDGYIYFSNGGIGRISTLGGGTIDYLTSLPEPHGGPFVIVGDTCYFVNYDISSPANDWSKISKISISKGGLAQNNEVLQTKRIVDLERDDSCLYWLCASAWENGKLIGNGKIQKLNISTRVVTTLADSLHAQDNIAIYGDSIYFGERGVQNPGLKRISKSGAESRILISGACGAVAVDSLSVTYFRIADSTLNSFDRIADSSRKLLHLPDSSVSIEIDSRYIYCVSQRQCDFQSTLRKISRETLNEVILNDSISCNPFFVVDSTVAYVSDDLVGGRIRQICNPEVIEGYNVIIPSTLDFGNIIIGQSSARVLPVMNASPNDVTIYASVVGGLFSIYPPSLSIPAHSTMPFTVRCNSDASDVQDQAVFSVNGPAPFATTVLTALGLLNTVENAPVSDDPVFRYTGNYLHVNLTSGRYALHVTDELGRVLRSWEGEGEGKIESFDLDIPNRLLFINLNQASSEHTMKIVRLGR